MIAALDVPLDVAIHEDHVAVCVRERLALALGDDDGLAVVAGLHWRVVSGERTDARQVEDQRERRECSDRERCGEGRAPREATLPTRGGGPVEEGLFEGEDEIGLRPGTDRPQPRLHFGVFR